MSEIFSRNLHDDRLINPNQIYLCFGLKAKTIIYCFLSSTQEIVECESIEKSAGSH